MSLAIVGHTMLADIILLVALALGWVISWNAEVVQVDQGAGLRPGAAHYGARQIV